MRDGGGNLPLIIYYAVFIIIGALATKKKRWLGGLIGGFIALGLITTFAIGFGP